MEDYSRFLSTSCRWSTCGWSAFKHSFLRTRSCTDLYPLIQSPRSPLALVRGRILIPRFIPSPSTLAVCDVARSFLLGVGEDFPFTEDETQGISHRLPLWYFWRAGLTLMTNLPEYGIGWLRSLMRNLVWKSSCCVRIFVLNKHAFTPTGWQSAYCFICGCDASGRVAFPDPNLAPLKSP